MAALIVWIWIHILLPYLIRKRRPTPVRSTKRSTKKKLIKGSFRVPRYKVYFAVGLAAVPTS